MSGGVPTRSKALLEKYPLSQRKTLFAFASTDTGLHETRNKYYGVITKRMNFNYPVVETSESIEPNDNDLNAIAYTFLRSSGQPEFKQLFARPH